MNARVQIMSSVIESNRDPETILTLGRGESHLFEIDPEGSNTDRKRKNTLAPLDNFNSN